jgi:phosphonopyruvate decarboxylase
MSGEGRAENRQMITGEYLLDALLGLGCRFFTGVPDSVLGGFAAACGRVSPPARNVVAANEGNAVALAAGWWLARSEIGIVYLQNAGLGNAINPLVSLAHPSVYATPMVLIVGWRGQPGRKDEAQHRLQGEITPELLNLAGIETHVLEGEADALSTLATVIEAARRKRAPVALLVPPGLVAPAVQGPIAKNCWTRGDALAALLPLIGDDDAVVASTGFIARDVYEQFHESGRNTAATFLCVGAMGHASQIACGVALGNPERRVWCLDGDGAFLMHLGGAAAIAELAPAKFVHVVFDNGVHASVGGSSTCARLDLSGCARALGYRQIFSVRDARGLTALASASPADGPIFVDLRIDVGERKPLGRPPEPLVRLGKDFEAFLARASAN